MTIQGDIQNEGNKRFIHTSFWGTGELEDIRKNPRGVSGASITDEATQKRYFVLRDTSGKCACTTQITAIDAGATASFAAQFPAPPQGSDEVGFQLPTFPVVTVPLGG